MKLSYYIKAFPYSEKPGYLLLFSTRRSSKILLREETYDAILSGKLSTENESALLKLGMIVPDIVVEKAEVLGMLDEINAINDRLNVSVIINLACNFRCAYCYEGDMKGRHYMTDETARLLTEFIKDRSAGKPKINIDFYGGEPLLSLGLIKSISSDLRSFAQSKGAEYSFTLVTNGSLYKRRVAEELVSLGLYGIKTTLDGPPEVHNACRPFRSGAGSFETIIGNIKETWDIAKIGLGGNYTQNVYEDFPLLMDRLEKDGLTPEKLHEINFYPVMKNPGDVSSRVDFTDGFMSVNEPWVIKAGTLLREEILRRGYRTSKVSPSPCQIDLNDSYVVNYDGSIYKCPSFIGRKELHIGNLREGIKDYRTSHKLGLYKNDECCECVYLPLCFGGCRYMTYVRDGNIDSVDCKKPYLDAALETLIKQEIKYKRK
ncbi:MAG: geopeptide radical SAM maturase [Nitrospirota bacterium]